MKAIKVEDEFEYQSGMNVFFSKEYSNFVKNEGFIYKYFFDGQFVIPVQIRKKFIFCYATLLSEPFRYKELDNSTEENFLNSCVKYLKKSFKVQWIINTASSFFFNTPSDCERIPFGSHVIDLTKSEEEILAAMHSKHRNVIKKAKKDGVEIKFGGEELLDDYLIADSQTWERSNSRGSGKNYYLKRCKDLNGKILIANAYLNGEIQSGGIFYYNNCMSYYMYGSSINKPSTGSANLMHWEVIKYMKKIGVAEYSFVGCRINEDADSKYHGIQRFKERFGGQLRQGFLFHTITNRFMYGLFKIGMQLRSRSLEPYKDAIDQEKHKWRDIQTRG